LSIAYACRYFSDPAYIFAQLAATLVKIAGQPGQVKKGLVYAIWLSPWHPVSQNLINPAGNIAIYVEWIVKQPSEA